MVFTVGCETRRAKLVRCSHEVVSVESLVSEAEQLWAADQNAPQVASFSAGWGQVALRLTPRIHDAEAGFLKERAQDWVPGHFKKGRKELRRRYFMGA